MAKNTNVLKCGQNNLESKLKYGDYTTLGIVLGCNADAAKKRFKRGNKQAEKALREIVENRERLIDKYQSKK